MRTRMTILAVAALLLPTIALGQSPPICSCSPAGVGTGTDVCPPTGNSMGQSNYMRATHEGTVPPQPELAFPQQPPLTTAQMEKPLTSPSEIGAGPRLDTTPYDRRFIAVDDKYVYVLQGDEVVKLDKSDLHEVARVKVSPVGGNH